MRTNLYRDLSPEAGRLEYVGLIHGAYFFLAPFGKLESQFHHPPDFIIIILKCIHGPFAAILNIPALWKAEVEATG